jgi:hypothetical protein
MEALGHYTLGALWPRRASQEAITSSLERELRAHPLQLLDAQVKDYEKATGEKIAPELIAGVKGDIDAEQHMKDFQRDYANSKGSSGFRNLPAINRLEAGIQYAQQHHVLPPQDLADFKNAAKSPGLDEATATKLANAVWGATGVGQYKRKWDELVNAQQGTKLRKRRG